MNKNSIEEYLNNIYKDYNIIKSENFIKNTPNISFCPVISTSIAIFLKTLLEMTKPKKVLELGTSIGYSTTIIAETISKWGGTITTVEIDKNVANVAKENFKKYNVSNNISLINENVFEVLPKMNQKFDLIFLDLFNGLYPDIMNNCIDLLEKKGILVADDTLFPVIKNISVFKESNKKIDEFNKRLSKRADMDSILLPVDDGITIAIKK